MYQYMAHPRDVLPRCFGMLTAEGISQLVGRLSNNLNILHNTVMFVKRHVEGTKWYAVGSADNPQRRDEVGGHGMSAQGTKV